MDKKMRIAKGYVEKGEMLDGQLDASVASTSVVDRDGEIISQDGWDLRNFKKNPQLLWAHNVRESRPPIGKITKVWIEGEGKNKKLMFKALFDMADAFAAEIYRKFKEGFLNAFSVGFMPLEREGNTYTQVELLEISAVPVPANPQALVELRAKGFEAMEWKDLEEPTEETQEPEETLPEEVVEPKVEEPKPEEPQPTEPKTEEPNVEEPKINTEEMKKQIREALTEIQVEKLKDALRIVYSATAIALKSIKDLQKGGEK